MFRSVISCLLLLTVLCVNVHNSMLSAQSDQSSSNSSGIKGILQDGNKTFQEMKRSISIIGSYESDGLILSHCC